MSADNYSRSIITVLGKSERQVVEFGVQNLTKKRLAREKNPILPSMNTHLGKKKKQNKKVRLTALTFSCNRNNTCAC